MSDLNKTCRIPVLTEVYTNKVHQSRMCCRDVEHRSEIYFERKLQTQLKEGHILPPIRV